MGSRLAEANESRPDFLAFILECEMQLWDDFDELEDAEQFQEALGRWREPEVGVLARLMKEPRFAQAGEAEQKIFRDFFNERIRVLGARFGLKDLND